MSVHNARPLLAFWLLALAAAVIAALGLHSAAVQVRTDSPQRPRSAQSAPAPTAPLLSVAAPRAH